MTSLASPWPLTGRYQEWAGSALPLGKRLFEVDYNAPKVQEIQKKYGSRVEVTWYHDSDWVTVASLDTRFEYGRPYQGVWLNPAG